MIFFPPFLQKVHGRGTAELALPVCIVSVGTTGGLYLGGRIGKSPRRLFVAEAATLAAALPRLAAFTLDSSLWLTVATTSLFIVLGRPFATLTYVVGTEVGGPLRGTLADLLSGSGYASYVIGATDDVAPMINAVSGSSFTAYLIRSAARLPRTGPPGPIIVCTRSHR